jgi:hypothetical protein
MLVERKSRVSGLVHALDLNITPEQLARVDSRFESGELIQNIVPHLSVDEREFLMTGITGEEWTATFGEDN